MHEPHELALLVPPMSKEDYARLRDDIAANGLREPITLYEDRVLDGIHRERICAANGTEPRYETFTGTREEAARVVFSKNIARRHLNQGQLAVVVAKLLPLYESRIPKGRPEKGGARATFISGHARDAAAKDTGASPRSIQTAKRLLQERPDLAKKVEQGKMSLRAADNVVRKPKAEPKPSRRRQPNLTSGTTNTTRQRELRDQKRQGDYSKLLALQLEVSKLTVVLEDYKPMDFGLDEATLALVDSFHDDLIALTDWVDRALLATQAWLNEAPVIRKIRALRNTTGRTEEEAKTAIRLADRLERKLGHQLVS
jgi:hypothetical protein